MEHIDLIRQLVATHLTVDPESISGDEIALEQLSGGDINDAAVVYFRQQTFFAKWNTLPRPRQFEVEANGLERLRKAAPLLGVPEAFAFVDHDVGGGLLLEYFEGGRPAEDFDAQFGRGLAQLHETTDTRGFGLEFAGYCGSTPLRNAWDSSWIDFYREQRLLPLIDLCEKRGMPKEDVAALHRLLPRLDKLLTPGRPSLIHGDLWTENQIIAPDGRPAILDPAAYFAHPEMEFGMMLLFGGFPERVFDAYEEVRPLDDGWRDRTLLYQLFHVLNHYHLFGGAYGMQAARIANQYQ